MEGECCHNCRWWVYEDDNMNWEHDSAVEHNREFCVLEDLFTFTDSDYICSEYCKE